MLSLTMILSVFASFGAITASAAIGSGVAWLKVFTEDFDQDTETTYYTTTNTGYCFTQGDPDTVNPLDTGDVFRIATTSGKQSLKLISEASPLYDVTNNNKVRFEFDLTQE